MTHDESDNSNYQVSLLEFNAEPAIEMTGPRLRWILEDLYEQTAEVAVKPFISGKHINEGGHMQLQCCLNIKMNR